MAYHQQKLKQLGNIVANRNRLPIKEVFLRYEQTLYELFARRSRCNCTQLRKRKGLLKKRQGLPMSLFCYGVIHWNTR
jgi:hypothetical protein